MIDKKKWYDIQVGDRVTTIKHGFHKEGDQLFPHKTKITGTIKRINSNRSQALVEWDESKNEIWYGRTGIDLLTEIQ